MISRSIPHISHKWLQLSDTTMGTYNCWDTFATAALKAVIRDELSDLHQLEFHDNTYWKLVPAVMARLFAQRSTSLPSPTSKSVKPVVVPKPVVILAVNPNK